jgi:hypothetical protein
MMIKECNYSRVVMTFEEYEKLVLDFQGKTEIIQAMKENFIKPSAIGIGFYLNHINGLDKLTAICLLSPFMTDETTDEEWNKFLPSHLKTEVEEFELED